MKEMLTKILREEDGQGMVEYGLIIAGIAIAAIAAIVAIGPMVNNMFTETQNAVGNVPTA